MEVCAQEDVEEAEAQHAPLDSGAAAPQPKISPLDTIPESARAIFDRYVQKEDTVKAQLLAKYRSNSFLKRLSFHTNAVDWATLVPNIGIEFDLKGTTRTQYSILLHAKYNGGSNAAGNVFNVNAVRVAVALPCRKRTSVQRNADDDFLVIDRRVKRRRAVVANHVCDFIRGGSIVRRVVHDDIFHVLCAGLHRDFQIVFGIR